MFADMEAYTFVHEVLPACYKDQGHKGNTVRARRFRMLVQTSMA